MNKTLFTSIILTLFCQSIFCQLRTIILKNKLRHTEYNVSVWQDNRCYFAKIPPAPSDKSSVSFYIYDWTERVVVSVSPAEERSDYTVKKVDRPSVNLIDGVTVHSPYVWEITPKVVREKVITIHLTNPKKPKP